MTKSGSDDPAQEALDKGVLGTVHDPIENEAYTVSGQGPDTAKREREARGQLRQQWQQASEAGEDEPDTTSTKSSSKSSGSSSSSGTSSSSS